MTVACNQPAKTFDGSREAAMEAQLIEQEVALLMERLSFGQPSRTDSRRKRPRSRPSGDRLLEMLLESDDAA